jgi:hypothetical protein
MYVICYIYYYYLTIIVFIFLFEFLKHFILRLIFLFRGLLSLSDKHKKDLAFLKRIDGSSEDWESFARGFMFVIIEQSKTCVRNTLALDQFCQIALKFTREGFDKKIFLAAASNNFCLFEEKNVVFCFFFFCLIVFFFSTDKFGLSPEPLKKALEALGFLFTGELFILFANVY